MTRRLNWLDGVQEHTRKHRRLFAAGPMGLLTPFAPEPESNFPRCETCGHELLDAIDMVDENRLSVVIRGRHHGREDTVRITFETPWDEADLARALRATVMFPTSHAENASR